MHRVFYKIMSLLISIMMIGVYFMPISVYAANELKQNNETDDESVKFNATINGTHETELDINSEGVLELSVSVAEGEYLKDVRVSLENNNYSLGEISDVNIKLTNDNVLELGEVNSGEEINTKIPIAYSKNEFVTEDDFKRDSQVKLQATYVNHKGNEKIIEKTITENLKWKTSGTEVIKQELNRYIKYENKTLVSFEINEGVQDDTVPVKNKEISVIVPKIENKNPSKVIVTGNNIDYNYSDGILIIKKNMISENGKYTWNSADKYSITYIYDNQTNAELINSNAQAVITTIDNMTLKGDTELNEFETSDEVGSLVEVGSYGTSQLSKGYLYTNTKKTENKLDTVYDLSFAINIGYADALDTILVQENAEYYEDENGNLIKEATDVNKTKKIMVNEKELVDVLGENGSIIVRDDNNNVIGTINKENKEIDVDAYKLSFEVSKPVKEGIININTVKVITGEGTNSKEEIDSFKNLKTILNNKGFGDGQEISNSVTVQNIILTDVSSKANLTISTDRLSTVVKNENVVFNIVLNKNDIDDALYTNPKIRLRLPEQITNIELLSGNLLYDNELKPELLEIDGRDIVLSLEGTQTEYNTSTTNDGTLIRFETNLTLNTLIPSSTEKVQVECYNEYTGELATAESEINIVAPAGFVTTNTIRIDENEKTAVENDAELIRINHKESAKTMEVQANLVNNINADADGLVVIGRIPASGNKTIGGVNLGTNVDTQFASPIELSNFDNAIVYYSTNIDEDIDGDGWTTEVNLNSKSFKIVSNEKFDNRKMAAFKYSVTIPENLGYDKVAKENYGVYYNNDAEEGVTRNLVESKIAGFLTGTAPEIKVEVSAVDTNAGYTIDQNGNVKEGEYVTYGVKLSNNGTNDATNVYMNVLLPDGLSIVEYEPVTPVSGRGYVINKTVKNIEEEIGTINGGESYTYYYNTFVSKETKDGEDNELTLTVNVSSDILESDIEEKFVTKNNAGYISAKMYSSENEKVNASKNVDLIINIQNPNSTVKKNVVATVNLPDGIKFNSLSNNEKYELNDKKNELKIYIDELKSFETKKVCINTTNNSDKDELSVYALVKCDESKDEIKTNVVKVYNVIADKTLKVTHTSNVSSDVIDSDKIDYYIDINNLKNQDIKISIKDVIPKELRVERYYIYIDNSEVYSGTLSFINHEMIVPAGKNARVVISTRPFEMDQGKKVEIVNAPKVKLEYGEEVEVNEIKLNLNGTRKVKNKVVEEGKEENSETKESRNSFRITGTAWLDQNKNGQKDLDESKVEDLVVKLYNSETKDVAKDENGKEMSVTTNANGEYAFNNLTQGEYVVVSEFDDIGYQLTNYKDKNAQESNNSDFVSTEVDGKVVAATDVLKLVNENINGIDLGLMPREHFNLDISNSISKITVVNSNGLRKEYEYDKETAKIELSDEDVKNATLLIEYTINVSNIGNVEGYAKSIVNYIPKGLTFNSEYNTDWYLAKDGNLYTVSLANKKINPGESESIKLVLVKKVTADFVGIIREKTQINTTYNEKGLAEINALASNKANTSAADVIVSRKAKVSALSTVAISVGLISIFAIAVYNVRKHIDKAYKIDM